MLTPSWDDQAFRYSSPTSGISDPFRPVETAAFVPAAPARLMDDRPGVPQISAAGDVFVDAQGLLYTTDQNGGLSILERT